MVRSEKSYLNDAGKDREQEDKGAKEDELLGWHYWLKGHEFEQTQEASEGQGSLACCSSWGHRVGCDIAMEQQVFTQKLSFPKIFSWRGSISYLKLDAT